MAATVRGRIEDARAVAAAGPAWLAAKVRPIAIGWATVELGRAVAELSSAFGLPTTHFEPAPRSMTLGCACLVARGVLPGGAALAVLEPDIEGRLAGVLARLGEGPAVTWLRADEPDAADRLPGSDAPPSDAAALRAAGFVLAAERDGPFGPERLIVDETTYGPYRLLLGRPAGTIK